MAKLTDKTAPVQSARWLVYIAAVLLGAYALQVFGLPIFDWLFFAAAALVVIGATRDRDARKYAPSFLICTLLLLVGIALTAFLNPAAFSTIKRLAPVPYIFAVFLPLFTMVITRMSHLRVLYMALVVSAAITGVAAILQATVGLDIADMEAPTWGRMTGLLRHPNELGAYGAVVVPLGLSLAVVSRGVWRRLLWSGLVVSGLAGIVVSVSLSGAAAAAVGVLAFFLFSPRSRKLKTWLVLLGAVAVLVGAYLLLSPVLQKLGVPLITERLQGIGSGDATNTWASRMRVNGAALEYIAGRPLIGYPASAGAALQVHNGFLRFWYEMGLFGFFAVVALITLAARSLFARAPRGMTDAEGRRHYWLRAGAVASFLAFMTVFMVSPIMTDRSTSIALAVAFAFRSASGEKITFRRRKRYLRNPRIAIVYDHFPHYRKGIFKELARVLDVTFVGDSRNPRFEVPGLVFGKGAKLIEARCYQVGPLLFQPRAIWIAMFGRFDVFVYLANPWFITTWCAAIICRLRGKRVIFWGHGFLSSKERIRNVIRALYYSLANGFYSYGHRSKIIAQRFRFKPKNLYVGYNSLDYLAQIGLRQRCQADPGLRPTPQQSSGLLRVLCISRLTEACRYDLLLRAAAQAKETSGMNVIIAFFGEGPARPALEELADELEVPVVFNGAIYDNAVLAPLIYSADVTVSPGKVGLTAVHSLMFGTPVISHRDFNSQMPEVEAIVEGYSGMLFNKDDEGDLARALVDFRQAFPDRERTRENCFAVVDWFYNPARQRKVFLAAVHGVPAVEGDDMQRLFPLRHFDEGA